MRVFDVVVGQVVQGLQHQDFEYGALVPGFASGRALAGLRRGTQFCLLEGRAKFGAEGFPWDQPIQRDQGVVLAVQALVAAFKIKETGLGQRESRGSCPALENPSFERLDRGIFRGAHNKKCG